jgi:hypothetical protein
MTSLRSTPCVFISSTVEDLKDYRAAARDAALRAGFLPDLQEYWEAKDNSPYQECMERVAGTDVLVVIVAHRYGWVPPDQPGKEGKSITWLECEQAIKDGHEVLAFLLEDAVKDWPEQHREDYRLPKADDDISDEEFLEIRRETKSRKDRLKAFKDWLNSRGIRKTFGSPDDLCGKIVWALGKWRQRHAAAFPEPKGSAAKPVIPPGYLDWLRRECESVELLGLEAKEARAVKLGEVYVPAVTISPSAQCARPVHAGRCVLRAGRGPPRPAPGGARCGLCGAPGALRARSPPGTTAACGSGHQSA